MKIMELSPPCEELEFLNAGRGPGGYYVDRLPVHIARVTRLPAGLSAIVATADLQGRAQTVPGAPPAPPPLLGEVLPRTLREDLLPALNVPVDRVGAILGGDFYTVPLLDRRGGTGDVTRVWQAFANWFDWVVGVAGNHDMFEHPSGEPRVSSRAHYLDDATTSQDGIRFAGLGGIIGNPKRLMRRSEDAYCRAVENLVATSPDILLTHDGPDDPVHRQRGSSRVRGILERSGPQLVVRGHAHWETPLITLPGGTQVLNVDCRVAVLVQG